MDYSDLPFKKLLSLKRKKFQITPEEVKFLRSGNNNLINVKKFKETKIQLKRNVNHFLKESIQKFNLNDIKNELDVDDLKIPPFDEIIKENIDYSSLAITGTAKGRKVSKELKEIMYSSAFERKILEWSQITKPFRSIILPSENNWLTRYERYKEKTNSLGGNKGAISGRNQWNKSSKASNEETEVTLKIFVHDWSDKKVSMELLMKGSNSLLDLRGAIHCENYKGEKSRPDLVFSSLQANSIEEKNMGFFFIENTFYDSHSGSQSQSQPIFEWLKSSDRYKDLTQKPMETQLEDIEFKIGSFYLYQHKKSCKHILRINEIRAEDANEIKGQCRFPLVLFKKRHKFFACDVCEERYASYATYGDTLTFKNGSKFCRECFDMLHCDSSGQVLKHEFEVFTVNLHQ